MTRPLQERITFDRATETMEVNFEGVRFNNTDDVNAFYDFAEEAIAETGEKMWYFLVNLHKCRIEPEAWMAYGQRGRELNEAHSLGSVRYDASDETRDEIASRAGSENFDANLFDNREDAVARIAHLRSIAPKRFPMKPRPKSVHGTEVFAARTTLHHDKRIMEADFSNFTFNTLGDVHDFYDYLDHEMRVTNRRWFFLVNLENTRIMPEVWGAYANRGKKLNMDFALGSVRYDASSETAEEIAHRAHTENFDPNLCPTREAALRRVEELRAEMSAQA